MRVLVILFDLFLAQCPIIPGADPELERIIDASVKLMIISL
jgi:hypothetical protein